MRSTNEETTISKLTVTTFLTLDGYGSFALDD
jgi:hypothetical protein